MSNCWLFGSIVKCVHVITIELWFMLKYLFLQTDQATFINCFHRYHTYCTCYHPCNKCITSKQMHHVQTNASRPNKCITSKQMHHVQTNDTANYRCFILLLSPRGQHWEIPTFICTFISPLNVFGIGADFISSRWLWRK